MTESSFRDHIEAAEGVSALGVAIVTCSDTRDLETDKSGALIAELVEAAGHVVRDHVVVKDDPEAIRGELVRLIDDPRVAMIVMNGGTGIANRDTAYEVVVSLLDKTLDGFGELFRSLSYAEIGAAAMMSRAIGGVAGGTILFSLPGSTNAVRLGMEKLILPQAGHLHHELHK